MKPGRDADGAAQTEADHFGNCPVRGALVSAEIRFLLAPGRVGNFRIKKRVGPAVCSALVQQAGMRNHGSVVKSDQGTPA